MVIPPRGRTQRRRSGRHRDRAGGHLQRGGLLWQERQQDGGAHHPAENNLYFGASTSSPGNFPDPHARYENPLLVSPPGDLHLKPGSPALDSGLMLGNDAQGQPLSGTLDIDGNPRVSGAAINLGAHELD